MSEQAQWEPIQRLYDIFNTHKIEGIEEIFSEDFELVDYAMGATLRGPEGARQWLETFLMAMPDANATVINKGFTDEWVFTEHVGRGTHSGPLITPNGSVPATGRKVELPIAEAFRVENGKITLIRAYYDSAMLLRQLGVSPQANQ